MKEFFKTNKYAIRAKKLAMMLVGVFFIADGIGIAYMMATTTAIEMDGKSDVYAACALAVMLGGFLLVNFYAEFMKTFEPATEQPKLELNT